MKYVLLALQSDGEFICKKVKGEESAEEECSEDIAIEELEESEDSDKEHKIKKAIVERLNNDLYQEAIPMKTTSMWINCLIQKYN